MSDKYTKYQPPEKNWEDITSEEGLDVRQVQWAWVWSSMPWLIVAFVLLAVGFLEEILTTLFVVVIVLPRYLRWRRTQYRFTHDTLFYQQGGITGFQKYEIPVSEMRDVRHRFGMFGRSLGYQTVDIMLDNGSVASLQYISPRQDLSTTIRRLIDSNPPPSESDDQDEEDPDNNNPDEAKERL